MEIRGTTTFNNLNLKFRAISKPFGAPCDRKSVLRTSSYNSKSSTRHNSDNPQNIAKFGLAIV